MRLLLCGDAIGAAPQREGRSCTLTFHPGWDFLELLKPWDKSHCVQSGGFTHFIQSSMNSGSKGKSSLSIHGWMKVKRKCGIYMQWNITWLSKRKKKSLAYPLLLAFYHWATPPTSERRLDTYYSTAELWGNDTMNKRYFKRSHSHVKGYLLLVDWLEHHDCWVGMLQIQSQIAELPLVIAVHLCGWPNMWLSCETFWNVLTHF